MTLFPIPFAGTVLLYVEEDADASFLFRLVLESQKPFIKLFVIEECEDALNFLQRKASFAWAPSPHLVVLGLHLPDCTELQLLENIRRDEQLAGLPVVFFSTSTLTKYRTRALELGALGFFLKPLHLTEFEQTLADILRFVP